MGLSIQHQPLQRQFIVVVNQQTAHLKYHVCADEKILDYYHTYVPPALRGQNIGQKIVKFALDYAKENHLTVIPTCPFIRQYIEQHPEYKPLVHQV